MSLADISLAKLFVSLGFSDPDGVVDTLEEIQLLTEDIADSFSTLDFVAGATLSSLQEHGTELSRIFTDVIESMEKIPSDLRNGDAYVDVYSGEASNQIMSSALESAIEDLADNVNQLGIKIGTADELSASVTGMPPIETESSVASISDLLEFIRTPEPTTEFDVPDAGLNVVEGGIIEKGLREFSTSFPEFAEAEQEFGAINGSESVQTKEFSDLVPIPWDPSQFKPEDLSAGVSEDKLSLKDLLDLMDARETMPESLGGGLGGLDSGDLNTLSEVLNESIQSGLTQDLGSPNEISTTFEDFQRINEEVTADLTTADAVPGEATFAEDAFVEAANALKELVNKIDATFRSTEKERRSSELGGEELDTSVLTAITEEASAQLEAFREMKSFVPEEALDNRSSNIEGWVDGLLSKVENSYERVEGLLTPIETPSVGTEAINETTNQSTTTNEINLQLGSDINVSVSSEMNDDQIREVLRQHFDEVEQKTIESVKNAIAASLRKVNDTF